MTTRKKTIAVPVPGSGVLGRYDALVASGVIRLKPTTQAHARYIAGPDLGHV